MSGIAGLVHRDGSTIEPPVLAAMIAALAHRGPDGAVAWCAGPAGLAQLLLRTTPEAPRDAQPLHDREGDRVLVADLRLDNRDELCDRLGLRERRREITDGETVLAAYARWGDRCPEHLLGDFALAIWDARRERLFCARDHMGVKPFYYACSARRFAFASEIKALLRLPDVPRRANEARVAEFLCLLESERKDTTFYRHIRRLPPGHCLVLDGAGVRVRRYWALDPRAEIRLRSDGEYAERFRELFTDAVRVRMRSAYPIGSVLSGGLDSACVTVMARRLHDGAVPLHALSAYFTGEGDTDERPYIDAILAGGGVQAHRIDGNTLDISPGELDQIVAAVEEPIWYAFLLVLWRLYGVARAQGVRVLLDGTDGDSTVAECRHTYLPWLLRTGRWRTFAAEIDAGVRRSAPSSRRLYARRWGGRIWRTLVKPLFVDPLEQRWRHLRGQDDPVSTLLSAGIAHRAALEARLRRHPQPFRMVWQAPRAAHHAWLTASAFPYHLEMLDRAAAAFGLEYRHPFFDKRLVEFCLALPPEQRYHRAMGRVVMRRALAPLLPDNVLQRPGKGAVMHHYQRPLIERWCAPAATGQPALGDWLARAVPALATYVDRAAMEDILHRYLAGGQGAPSVGAWYLTSLALWLAAYPAYPPGGDRAALAARLE